MALANGCRAAPQQKIWPLSAELVQSNINFAISPSLLLYYHTMSADQKPAEIEDDVEDTGKTAEDRALASLDTVGPQSDDSAKHVDQEAVSKAMKNLKLGGTAAASKKVKVEAADVALLVCGSDGVVWCGLVWSVILTTTNSRSTSSTSPRSRPPTC